MDTGAVLGLEPCHDLAPSGPVARPSLDPATQALGRGRGAVVQGDARTERRHDRARDVHRQLFGRRGRRRRGQREHDEGAGTCSSKAHDGTVAACPTRWVATERAAAYEGAEKMMTMPPAISAAPDQIHHVSGLTKARSAAPPSASNEVTTT